MVSKERSKVRWCLFQRRSRGKVDREVLHESSRDAVAVKLEREVQRALADEHAVP
ncbi:hypothetical protein PINS_up003472 [Pythium insidiosum]|nr:hypothetical protein PINS_up003472 [Pythium insidiosum]